MKNSKPEAGQFHATRLDYTDMDIVTLETNPFFQQPKVVRSRKMQIVNFLQGIVIIGFIIIVLYLFVITPNQVDGVSMQPNFATTDVVLTNRLSRWFGNTQLGDILGLKLSRGDVVVVDTQGILSEDYIIKRIIGIAADKIAVKDGFVYLNGTRLDETDYLPPDRRTSSSTFLQEGDEITIPAGRYAIMGDNRPQSIDSRFSALGLIPHEKLIGRVILRFFPFDKIGFIPRGEIKFTSTRLY